MAKPIDPEPCACYMCLDRMLESEPLVGPAFRNINVCAHYIHARCVPPDQRTCPTCYEPCDDWKVLPKFDENPNSWSEVNSQTSLSAAVSLATMCEWPKEALHEMIGDARIPASQLMQAAQLIRGLATHTLDQPVWVEMHRLPNSGPNVPDTVISPGLLILEPKHGQVKNALNLQAMTANVNFPQHEDWEGDARCLRAATTPGWACARCPGKPRITTSVNCGSCGFSMHDPAIKEFDWVTSDTLGAGVVHSVDGTRITVKSICTPRGDDPTVVEVASVTRRVSPWICYCGKAPADILASDMTCEHCGKEAYLLQPGSSMWSEEQKALVIISGVAPHMSFPDGRAPEVGYTVFRLKADRTLFTAHANDLRTPAITKGMWVCIAKPRDSPAGGWGSLGPMLLKNPRYPGVLAKISDGNAAVDFPHGRWKGESDLLQVAPTQGWRCWECSAFSGRLGCDSCGARLEVSTPEDPMRTTLGLALVISIENVKLDHDSPASVTYRLRGCAGVEFDSDQTKAKPAEPQPGDWMAILPSCITAAPALHPLLVAQGLKIPGVIRGVGDSKVVVSLPYCGGDVSVDAGIQLIPPSGCMCICCKREVEGGCEHCNSPAIYREGDLVVLHEDNPTKPYGSALTEDVGVVREVCEVVKCPERDDALFINDIVYRIDTPCQPGLYVHHADIRPHVSHLDIAQEVRVAPTIEDPLLGWGGVRAHDTGVVTKFSDDMLYVHVDFPRCSDWRCLRTELVAADG
eukprot:TRINITY_DN21147_c0_g2_i1.p1 TRINITY_DN21147_c0_g2~~TRINITY_DN21147_c0_g2_i1.p1  ORF type:complete len:746 (+),score=119.39 TRINITY_DN21147_c0_g2_i1:193-2430(+)